MDNRPRHGARFVLEHVPAEPPAAGEGAAPAVQDPPSPARYRVTIHWPDREESLDLLVQADGAAELEPTPTESWAADALRGFARSLCSSARAARWPVRLVRWRDAPARR